jgi:AcrR family transcriptional regulator
MGPATPSPRMRRERERRERLFLAAARELLLERGYLGLTMDRVAERTEYSKGTLYQHFSNKEEIVVALGIAIAEVQQRLFRRAAEFEGLSRERLFAIGRAYRAWAMGYPEDIAVTQIIKHRSLRGKVGAELVARLDGCEQTCSDILSGVVREGVAAGDVALPAGFEPGHLAFGLWAMSWGSYTLTLMDFDLSKLEVADSFALLDRHCHALLDGYGWRPLYADHDWNDVLRRVEQHLEASLPPPAEALGSADPT